MHITIPPLTMIVSRLERLTDAETRRLASDSGVPFGTINKIRHGVTKNPGIETVRLFFPLLPDLPKQGKQEHQEAQA